MPKRYGLSRSERLKSRKQIDRLFEEGKAISFFPVRAIYSFCRDNENGGLQIGVTASKKNFKKAADRNRIKRLLREAYRLQKEELALQLKETGFTGNVFFIFTDKTLPTFQTVMTSMGQCLQRLGKIVQSEIPS